MITERSPTLGLHQTPAMWYSDVHPPVSEIKLWGWSQSQMIKKLSARTVGFATLHLTQRLLLRRWFFWFQGCVLECLLFLPPRCPLPTWSRQLVPWLPLIHWLFDFGRLTSFHRWFKEETPLDRKGMKGLKRVRTKMTRWQARKQIAKHRGPCS